MSDFFQHADITTIHDLNQLSNEEIESLLISSTENYKIGLVLPITAKDMRAEQFKVIVEELYKTPYIDTIVVALSHAPNKEDYRDTVELISKLGEKANVLWIDGPSVSSVYKYLTEAGFDLNSKGKGQSVWTAFGYLFADQRLRAIALHDCDIVDYDRFILARLCLPVVHPSLDYEFCKAYYARHTERMYGRVGRLFVGPLLRALLAILGPNPFLVYLSSFRYPLSGEYSMTTALARSNRVPRDWGLEIGMLAEVHRNTSVKRICQVDLCRPFQHKHQSISLNSPDKGLMKMAHDILMTFFRNLASSGVVLEIEQFNTLRSTYLRSAQDAIRQYNADALVNGLKYERDKEEQAVEGFAAQITRAGEQFYSTPYGDDAIPNWTRIISAFPELPKQLRRAAVEDRASWL